MLNRLAIATSAGALAALLALPAAAQDVDWTGTYVGAQLGYGGVGGGATIVAGGDTFDTDLDGSGWNGGLTVGYRHDLGNWVVGGQAQFDWQSNYFDDFDDDLPGDLDDVGKLKDVWRFAGLAGYDMGRTLVYGTLGWTRASLETRNDTFDGSGVVVSGGVDYLVTERVTVGGELIHMMYDDISSDDESFDIDVTRLQAKVTFRF